MAGGLPHPVLLSTFLDMDTVTIGGQAVEFKHVFYSWVCMAILFTVAFILRRRLTLVPGGLQNFFEALIDAMPGIAPAICYDSRFNHVDAFYKELFKQHSCEALVAIVKGLRERMSEKKTKSSRAESTMKRAKDMLHGELSIALGMDVAEVEDYIRTRLGGN